ncbi:hypothetical protein ETU08_08095 [Apibacter muscae]|uniref:hypothetical protein n=1 Tax=Apibacter muscae TaxID=2509004 RepID=UPI0011AD8C3A|nr:hypothetical protein [Apibacter muscae]TWP29235.1 hypothetical protein ETU08_08095 [Apibacter muscae]
MSKLKITTLILGLLLTTLTLAQSCNFNKLVDDLSESSVEFNKIIDKEEGFSAWLILAEEAPSLRTQIEELNLVSKHLAEIKKAGGYKIWKAKLAQSTTTDKLPEFIEKIVGNLKADESTQALLRKDLNTQPELLTLFEKADNVKKIELAEAWKVVNSYPGLRVSEAILEDTRKLLTHTKLAESGLNKELLEQLVKGNRGAGATELQSLIQGYDNLITNGVKFENIDRLISDLNKGGNFAEGAQWVQRYMVKNTQEFAGKTVAFEQTLSVSGNLRRRIDLITQIDGELKSTYYEFKSVQKVPPANFAEQFIKDLNLDGVSELNQLRWIFDGKKVSSLEKKAFVEELLKRQDFLENKKIQGLFKSYYRLDEITQNQLKKLLENNHEWFNEIFKIN